MRGCSRLVFLQQSHLLSQSQFEALGTDALQMHNGILDVTDAENAALGAVAQRWFVRWKLGGYGLHSTSLSGPGLHLSAWLRALPEIANAFNVARADAIMHASKLVSSDLHQAETRLSHFGVNH